MGKNNPISALKTGSKFGREGLTRGGEVFAGQVHLEVNRPQPSASGLVVEPAISGDDDMVPVVPGSKGDALGLDLETVPVEQFAQGNVARAVGETLRGLVPCPLVALAHAEHHERRRGGACPDFGANFEARRRAATKSEELLGRLCCADGGIEPPMQHGNQRQKV